MKRVIMKSLALLLAIMTVCGLAACGTNEKQDGVLDHEPVVSGTIKFSYEASTESKKNAANAYIDAFVAKYPNAKVERDYDYTVTQAETRLSSGQIGDVFYFAESKAYDYAITHEALMPLEYYIEAFDINVGDIYSGIYSAGMIGNHYYYVARDFNQMIMIYNKDQVVTKGLTGSVQDGWTWDSFLNICQQLTDDSYYGASIQLAYAPTFIPLLTAYTGTQWFDTTNHTVDLTSGDTLKAIEELLTAYANGYINLGLAGGDLTKFEGKEPVFRQNVYPHVEGIGQEYDNNLIEWDMIHLPLTENPAFGCGSSGVGVYNGTQNPDTAAAFALFFYTQEGQEAFNGQDGGSVPVLASLKDADFWRHADDDWKDKNWDAHIYQANDYAVIGQFKCVLPSTVADVFEKNLSSYLVDVVNNSMSLADAMTELQNMANAEWESIS